MSRGEEPRFPKDPNRTARWADEADEEWEELELDVPSGLSGVWRRIQRSVKKNPVLGMGLLALGVLAPLAILFAWQLGWFEVQPPAAPAQTAARPVEDVAPSTASVVPAEEIKRETPPLPVEMTPAPKISAQTAPPATAPSQPPPLPDDVSQWRRADFFRAWRENSPQLPKALDALTQKARGNDSAFRQLAELLKSPPDEAPASNAVERIGAVVAGLAASGSKEAKKVLENILTGQLETDDDRAAVAAALHAMAAGGGDCDDLLLRAVLKPDALRPTDRQGSWPAKDLRAKAIELVQKNAAEAMRVKLAEALAQRMPWLAAGDPLRELLLVPDPRNCGAQLVLYQQSETPREIKVQLERQFSDLSASLLARRLRFEGSGAASADDSDSETKLAGLLWTGGLPALVNSQLGQVRSLEKQTDLVALAATLPLDSTRAALAQALRRNWNDGPKPLEATGLFDRAAADPGLVVLLKLWPRKDRRATPGAPTRNLPATPSPTTGRAARAAAAEQDWWDASAKLVAAWRKRLGETAKARTKAAVESGNWPGEAAKNIPPDFTPWREARLIASYRASWSNDAAVHASPLDVRYLCFEETGRMKRAIGYYNRQAQGRSTDSRTLDGAVWLDSLRIDAKADRRRSIDVLISRRDGQAHDPAKPDEETDLIVELLVIEIHDPLANAAPR